MSARIHESPENAPGCLQIGGWRFYVAAHRLERDGESVKLEPRVADLLHYLARRPGQPVSRATLLEDLWPGTVVGDEALTNAVNKLRRAFGDDRANPQVIETIPKAGYRLIAPVQPLATGSHRPALDTPPTTTTGRSRRRRFIPAAGLVLGAALVALLAMHWYAGREADGTAVSGQQGVTSARPALAVLPFDNLGPDPSAEYYVDGITDDVITRLAKSPGLMVISRDSSFFYKGKSLDPRAIAGELDADYFLRGSIRREGNLLKLNAWLVDTSTGAHVWAEHYEQPGDRIFEIQHQMTRGILTALAAPLATDAADTTTGNPQAYDALLLGRHHFYRFESRRENLKARTYFEEAIRLDPGFATALSMLAWTYAFEAMNGWTDDRAAALGEAARIATRAIELQPALPLPYYVRGLAYREQHEYVKALVEAQAAIKYDPSDANGHVLLATLLYYAGRPEEGLARIREAMQINPHHPYNYHFHLGQAYYVLKRYREAIDAFRDGLSSNPASERMRVWLAAALAQSGDLDEARWESEQIMAANPGFSVQRMAEAFPFKDPADRDHFLDGLRLAGLHD
jgi:TolB-like protein/DNA-binding winged helix-turn-helix (wHTH) protein